MHLFFKSKNVKLQKVYTHTFLLYFLSVLDLSSPGKPPAPPPTPGPVPAAPPAPPAPPAALPGQVSVHVRCQSSI